MSVNQKWLYFQRDKKLTLSFERTLLNAVQLRKVVVALRPLRMVFQGSFLFSDMPRSFGIEDFVSNPAKKRFGFLTH
jgi:hypothetical protein